MHTVCLASDGTVYTWGCNDEGALGRPGAENVPLKVDDSVMKGITDISAGDSHSIAWNTNSNEIYYWGCYRVSIFIQIERKEMERGGYVSYASIPTLSLTIPVNIPQFYM